MDTILQLVVNASLQLELYSNLGRTRVRLTLLKPKLVYVTFKNSVRTAKKTQHFNVTKINWLTLFKEIIAVNSENRTKHINTKCSVSDC
jgi:hypothetical protein